MCWITDRRWISEPFPNPCISVEDIEICKILSPNWKGIYYLFEYEPYKVYETELEPVKTPLNHPKTDEIFRIDKGFHSYSTGIKAIDHDTHIDIYYDDIYSKEDRFITSYVKPVIRVAGIIPKGSRYYLNEQGEYVSDQIKLLSERCMYY